jgi:SAM-dependent methyltransferase
MTWKVKAAIQRVLSAIPGGTDVNYLLQRYVAKTLPESEVLFEGKATVALRHMKVLGEQTGELGTKLFYEFGAGRDLCGPLVFYSMGVSRQRVVDLDFILRPFLVNDAIRRLRASAARYGLLRVPERFIREDKRGCLEDLRQFYGIEFTAPADARNTGFPAGSVDIVTSTNTLEHIPPADIAAILKETRRILSPAGVMSFQVDYKDHWSYFDSGITIYNFLRYPGAEWVRYNPSLNYQNRLRHADYLALYRQAGLDCVEVNRVQKPGDLELLASLPSLAPEFQSYSPEDLSVRTGFVLLRPKT